MNLCRAAFVLTAAGALSACAGGPKVPDWSINAVGHVERFTEAHLKGDARVAAREFELARAETARTGQPVLVARVELNRCAAQVASLDFGPCAGFEPLRADAGAAEVAYARYLAGEASAQDAAVLPAQHRAIAAGGADVAGIADPFARLVAAGVLLRQARATPDAVAQAVDTASRQGWRRPLLAWLGVQARLAEERGDAMEAARIRRRMDLVQPLKDARDQAGSAAASAMPGFSKR
jgi:hypothetical protein|nr:hypothetical protein [Ottowia sp.]